MTTTKETLERNNHSGRDLSGRGFGHVDATGYANCFAEYLEKATIDFRSVKQLSYELMGASSGDRVLDVGCGLGDDIQAISRFVEPGGCVVGIDSSAYLIRRAQEANAAACFAAASAASLPFSSDTFDMCRADRVLQHVPDPLQVVREMNRVLRPCGRVTIVDRDWDLVAIDSDDFETTEILLKRISSGIRNGNIGRQLGSILVKTGFRGVEAYPLFVPIYDLQTADALLDLRMVANSARSEGLVDERRLKLWIRELENRDRSNRFLSVLTLFVASGNKITARPEWYEPKAPHR